MNKWDIAWHWHEKKARKKKKKMKKNVEHGNKVIEIMWNKVT